MGGSLQEVLAGLEQLTNAGVVDIGVTGFALVMLASLLSSLYIAMLYVRFYGGRSTGSQVHRAFALLGISVTAIFICIQFSLPLSLGLLGALSIVRFRTPIKEPEEIGFIMLVIAASISAATFSMYFLLVLLLFATVLTWLQRRGLGFLRPDMDDGLVLLTLPADRYRDRAADLHRLLGERCASRVSRASASLPKIRW